MELNYKLITEGSLEKSLNIFKLRNILSKQYTGQGRNPKEISILN